MAKKKRKKKVDRKRLSDAFQAALAIPSGVMAKTYQEYTAKDKALNPKHPLSKSKNLTKFYK